MLQETDVRMTYDASTLHDAGATMVIRVKPTIRYRLRVRVALLLMRLAARVAGYGIDVRTDSDDSK